MFLRYLSRLSLVTAAATPLMISRPTLLEAPKTKPPTLAKRVDLNAELMARRRIILSGRVDEHMARKAMEELLYLDAISDEPIVIYINTGGGSVQQGFAIVDAMNCISSPVL